MAGRLTAGLPKKLLLATDLSDRSDRAFDRATQLARQWNAELIVVHALEELQGDEAPRYGIEGLIAPRPRRRAVSLRSS